jgi:alpha-N-arabinofuranosidase
VFDRNHRETGLHSIRYPGGTVGNTFEWKKAIGAVEKRPLIQPFSGGGTPTGVFGKPQVATFGVDEAARWCEKNEVTMIYMYGIAFGTPDDAADLVEYLNAPLGSNPGGGTNWANVRAENGHPAPYNIKYFEIANEADGPSQRYWWPFIDSDQTRAKAKMPFQAERDSYTPEFCFGGVTRFEKQLVGARDEQGGRDFRDEVARGSGKPGQSKVLRYVPTEPGSDQVFVGGEPWQRVDDLSAATGKVYRIEPKTGTILFGDGTKGDAPPQGAEIAASYRARRWGFVDYYAAMKKVDPTIRIYAGYESLNIVRTLGSKHPYDGVVVHPYTAQYKVPKADTLEDWHHNLMLSSDRLGHEVREYQELIDKTVTPERRGKVHVICTEFGALNQNQVMPAGNSEGYWRFLNIGLYTGAQLLEFMRIGVPQAHRHATTVGVLGPAPQFEMSPTALAYQIFTHHFGDRLIGIKLENNPCARPEPPTRKASASTTSSSAWIRPNCLPARSHWACPGSMPRPAATRRGMCTFWSSTRMLPRT